MHALAWRVPTWRKLSDGLVQGSGKQQQISWACHQIQIPKSVNYEDHESTEVPLLQGAQERSPPPLLQQSGRISAVKQVVLALHPNGGKMQKRWPLLHKARVTEQLQVVQLLLRRDLAMRAATSVCPAEKAHP